MRLTGIEKTRYWVQIIYHRPLWHRHAVLAQNWHKIGLEVTHTAPYFWHKMARGGDTPLCA